MGPPPTTLQEEKGEAGKGLREPTLWWRVKRGRTEPRKGDRKIWRAGGAAQRVRFGPERGQCPEVQSSLAMGPCSPSHPTWCLAELDPSRRGGLAVCACPMERCPPPSHSQISPPRTPAHSAPTVRSSRVQGPRFRKSPAPFPTSDVWPVLHPVRSPTHRDALITATPSLPLPLGKFPSSPCLPGNSERLMFRHTPYKAYLHLPFFKLNSHFYFLF